MIIRLLIYGLLFYAGYRVIRAWADKNAQIRYSDADKGLGKIDDVMIKDPYCQAYFPKKDGIHLRSGGKDLYFCSPECREKYINERGDG